MNLDHSFGGPLEDLLNVADCRSGFVLGPNEGNRRQETQSERESEERQKTKPKTKFRRAIKI